MSDDDPNAGDWRANLPEQLRDAPFLRGEAPVDQVLNDLSNAASHIGNSIRIPSQDASAEDMSAFYAKLADKAPGVMVKPNPDDEGVMQAFYRSMGQPDKPEDYSYTPPEGKEAPADFSAFAKAAHENGLTQAQFQGLLNTVLGDEWNKQDLDDTQQRDDLAALATEWGLSFQTNSDMIKNFLTMTNAPAGLLEMLANNQMTTDEMKWIHAIATQTKSPQELMKQPVTSPDLVSPAEAQNRIQEMLNNKQHPYWNATDPRHADAKRQMLKLQAAANPEASTSIDDLRL